MFDLIINNGKVVTAKDSFKADVGIKNGKILAIGERLKGNSRTEIIDAKGKLVMPGAIDVHVHLQLPFCGTVSADDFENGTKAAACGGVTTVIDYAIQTKGSTITEAIKARKKEAETKVCVDYSLHGGITDWNDRTQKEVGEIIKKEGIPSFKMFMIYKTQGWMADDGALYQALETTAPLGGMIMVHAESVFVLDMLVARYHEIKNKVSAYGHVLSRPNFTEYEAVQRAVLWAEVTGGKLYVVHISTGEACDILKRSQEKGARVYGETCPQYLLLDDSVFKGKDGHLYATCPQIKKKKDSLRLWKALYDGELAIVSTDTCTFDKKQKAMWKGDFTKIPFGMPGVETMLPLTFHFGKKKGFSINKIVEICCTNPAKLHGLYPEKGTLAIGSDADIVVYDPNIKVKIDYHKLQTNCDWSPYQGWQIQGWPTVTLSRGKIVAMNAKFVGEKGWGRFVKRKPFGEIR
ncbi:MAG: dihydropyrimidinase [Candidatus Hydrogenedentota bacterium]